MAKRKKTIIWVCAAAVVLAVVLGAALLPGGEAAPKAVTAPASGEAREASYQAYLGAHGYDGQTARGEVALDVFAYEAEERAQAERGQDGVLTGDTGVITWAFDVAEGGFYHLEVGYIGLPGTTSDIQRRVMLDGETPYTALSQIVFKRLWRDEEIRLKNDNEIRPNAAEVYAEQRVYLEDYDRRSGAPLLFYLSEGPHSLSFEAVKEPMELTSLVFRAAPSVPAYAETLSGWRETTAPYQGEPIVCQAERREGGTAEILKSSQSINVQKNYSDAALVPFHAWHTLYPTIGAGSWSQPGDAITWTVRVPEDGLYLLTFKGRQTNRGVTSYRRLKINGELPFAEAAVVGFEYSGVMQHYTLTGADGEPLRVRLRAGENTITLEVVLGAIGGVLSEVEQSLRVLNDLYLRTIQITGQAPSQFIDYEIARKVPGFVAGMREESQRLFGLVDEMVAITGEKGENTALLEKMAIEAEGLSRKPEQIVNELNQFKNNISALGTWIVNISSMPLELDSLILSADAASLPPARQSWWEGTKAGTERFFATFFHSSSAVESDSQDSAGGQGIKVWMGSSGREQAQIIQNMIDETFTPETGIPVKLQLIPTDVVLRAALAGNGPDVVIGLSQATAQDFAMRGAVLDLSRMEGFEEATAKYGPGLMRTASYQGGVWGIPEQVTFQMLFYRQDVLDDLGLEVPATWEEIMEMIPVLSRENYKFYLPSTRVATGLNVFSSMVYQFGGEIYTGEGSDYGISSALYSDEAMEAFKWYTDMFTVHGLEVQADFNNRFRTGEMPVGITDYTAYCTLEIFAPEIKGLWSFAPFPGTPGENGIDNTYVCDTVQTVIMQGADDRDAAWRFVRWWNSTSSQLSYANTLESIMGAAARYPAADPEVIRQLPWSNRELSTLLSQYQSLTGMPAVPGYYMNTRMISYAFEDVVADLSSPRETLYLNIRDIDRELTKKRAEFNLSTRNTAEGGKAE